MVHRADPPLYEPHESQVCRMLVNPAAGSICLRPTIAPVK